MGGVARGQSNPCNSANNHCVVLTWSPSKTWGIAGYNIFRSEKPGPGSFTLLNPSPVAAGCGVLNVIMHPHHRRERHWGPPCTWTDNSVQPGFTYFYRITAVDAGSKMQSKPSREVSVKVPANAH